MRQDQHGYIVVEAIGSFMMFVLLVVSILSLVNIVTLQARLHYALTQSAETLSLYSYVYKVTGAAGHLEGGAGSPHISAADFNSSMAGLISGLEGFAPGVMGRSGQAAANIAAGWPDDQQEAIGLLLDYGLDEGKNALAEEMIIRPLLGRYLSNGDMSSDEYLRSVNVIGGLNGLVFSTAAPGGGGSVLVDGNGDVKLVVKYEIAYKFGALPLPFEPKLRVTQTVKTKAWLGGRGEGYAYE